MTTRRAPDNKRLKRINSGDNHWYAVDGSYCPGVTTILKKGFPTPFSAGANWGATLAATYVVENLRWVTEAPDDQDIYQILKSLPNRTRNRAATRGKKLHTIVDELHAHGYVDLEDGDPNGPVVEGVAELLDAFDIRPLHSEVSVCNLDDRYAGTADLIALSEGLALLAGAPPDSLGVIDLKTGKAVYADAHMQIEAYRRSAIAHIDGAEVPMPPCEWAAVIHARPGLATVTVNRVAYHDRIYDLFRAAHTFWAALDSKRGWLDHAHTEAHEQPPTDQEIAAA